MSSEPRIIQGGMGIGVSSRQLAREVARLGQLGVVSGTALDAVLVRNLQNGDPTGEFREALAQFPSQEIAKRVLSEYFIEGGKQPKAPYRLAPMSTINLTREAQDLMVLAAFCEITIAKKGSNNGLIGINLLEKVQMPTQPTLYGAMLAGVDYVLMGAGIPREIPGTLDKLARQEDSSLRIAVQGATSDDDFRQTFSPQSFFENKIELKPLKRPKFLAIISSHVLALTLAKKANGKVDGFIIEGPLAGGHNAPPRDDSVFNERGEPVYGPRDEVDLEKIRAIGLPFWLAGTYGSHEKLKEALAAGAAGIQVGTAFALCDESGFLPSIRKQILTQLQNGDVDVFTDPRGSPTGFPFKVARLEGTASEQAVYEARPRRCDLGYLRTPFKKAEGGIGYRCASEPVDQFTAKGGEITECDGRKCLCNALMANIGLPQTRTSGYTEDLLITMGNDVNSARQFLKPGKVSYSAKDVIEKLLNG